MAKFFGRDSKYLIHQDHEYLLWAVGIILAPLLVVFLLIKFSSPAVVVGAAVVLLVFVIKWLQPLIYYFQNQSHKFAKGLSGEKDISKELSQLPDGYSVYHGVVLNKDKGDIDFVLVGPKGLFILEVKSIGGQIGYNGSQLTINNRPMYGKNYLEQTFGEARAVAQFLRRHLGVDVYVKPVLLFSHPHATAPFGDEPVDNVYVAQKDFLFSLIHSFPDYQWELGERKKVEAALLTTVK
jgi:hypothetical protein